MSAAAVAPTSALPGTRHCDSEERGDLEDGDDQCCFCGCLSAGLFNESLLIKNEGSTARDYLARERNFLSWLRLSSTLAVISAAMLLRFQFGEQMTVPGYELASEIPLGVLFFVAAGASLVVGVGGHFSHDRKMRGHSGFVYSGRGTRLVVWSIGGLTVATCILLIVAGESRT